jgi:hypothetical protein
VGQDKPVPIVTQSVDLNVKDCSPSSDCGGQLSDVWINNFSWSTSEYLGWQQDSSKQDLQELYNFVQAHHIKNLLLAGGAANICEMYKGDGVVQAKRLGFKAYLLRDMSFTGTPNSVYWAKSNVQDPWLTPDTGKAAVYKWAEEHTGGTIDGNELLAAIGPPYSYSTRIVGEPGLVSYWRMNGKTGYRHVDDEARTQGAWNATSIRLGLPGRAGNASAAGFDGTAALIAAPFFRIDLPLGSPLRSLSSAPFTVEAWIKVTQYSATQEFIVSHEWIDNNSNNVIDFLLGLDSSGHLTFSTRGEAGPATSSVSVPLGGWVHVVGVQDTSSVRVYVNGAQVGGAPISGSASDVSSALMIGSRGVARVAPDGTAFSMGSGNFNGQMEDVAIYNTALSDSTIAAHYAIGTH